jgi:trehalose 6-phosphate synthase/phosphatase
VFLKQDLLFDQYLALLTCANAFMVTSLREGMNLTSHEFIHCQDGKFSDTKHGPLILSEFTGSASIFDGHTLLVNPWDYQQCADAINTALEMAEDERERLWKRLHAAVTAHNTDTWFKKFVDRLAKVWEEQAQRDTVSVPRLSVNKLSAMYKRSSSRLFIIDYEGTLASWGSPANIILTTPKWAIDTLNELLEDPLNTVYVMSSRKPEEMERLFRPVQRLGLIAENGCFVRDSEKEEWVKLFDDEDTKAWQDSLQDMMNYFHERTEGSWIERRHASLVFHYANADDPQNAERHAGECANHINESYEELKIRAIQVEGAVVAEPIEPNKATAAAYVAQRTAKRGNQANPQAGSLDFLLVIGDGRDDEVAFRWANQLAEKREIENVLTVTLGSKSTDAMSTLTQGVTGMFLQDAGVYFGVLLVLTMTCAGVLSCLGKLAAISRSNPATPSVSVSKPLLA